MSTGFIDDIHSYIATNKKDLLKTKGELKVKRDKIVNNFNDTMTSRNGNSV